MKRLLSTLILIFVLIIGLGCEKKDQPVSKPKANPNAELPATLHQEGIRLYEERKYQEAINAWLKENELTPNKANVHNNIGMAYRNLNDLKTAMEYHKKAIEIDPNYGHAYYDMGLAYYYLKKYEEAAAAFQRAVDLNYYNADVYYSLAVTFRDLKNYQKAKIFLEKLIELNPHYPYAQDWLKQANLEIMKESNLTTAEDFFKLGMAYCEIGEFEDNAANAFKKAIEIDPSYPDAHYRLGYIYERRQRYGLAMMEYEKELEFHPTSENAISHISFLNRMQLLLVKIDSSRLFSRYSAFQGIGFPTKGIVVANKSILYALDLHHKKRELPKGERVTITGLFDKKLEKEDKSDFFYILEGEQELLNTKDVILESRYENPAYLSPNKKFRVVKNPIAEDKFYLWLRLDNKDPILLAKVRAVQSYEHNGVTVFGITVNDLYDDVSENYIPVTWSRDERYMFVNYSGEIYTPDGKTIKLSSKIYSSPIWHNNLLFLRGTGEDDAVYTFNLDTREFRKFLDVSGGERKGAEPILGRIKIWPPVQIKGNTMEIYFERNNKQAKNEDEDCMTIDVTADMNGKIIKKKKNVFMCNENI